MPKVSVLVPTYNCSKFLPEAIKSVLEQTFQDFEIIIIDDGSTDETAALVQDISNQHLGKIRYIYQKNKGLAVARNAGIEQSQGIYIALLDADDIWFPERLAEGIKAIESHPHIGLVHANITKITATGEISDTPERNEQFLSGSIFEYIFLRKADIACPTVLFRKECCNVVGIFDLNLTRLGCEDRDLWLRIAQEYKIVYINKILAYYRVTAQSMSQNLERMIKARLYIIDKYCSKDDQSKRKLRNRALAKVFRDIGDGFLLKRDFVNARQEYSKAIGYDPLAFWAWVNWIKAVLKYG